MRICAPKRCCASALISSGTSSSPYSGAPTALRDVIRRAPSPASSCPGVSGKSPAAATSVRVPSFVAPVRSCFIRLICAPSFHRSVNHARSPDCGRSPSSAPVTFRYAASRKASRTAPRPASTAMSLKSVGTSPAIRAPAANAGTARRACARAAARQAYCCPGPGSASTSSPACG